MIASSMTPSKPVNISSVRVSIRDIIIICSAVVGISGAFYGSQIQSKDYTDLIAKEVRAESSQRDDVIFSELTEIKLQTARIEQLLVDKLEKINLPRYGIKR